MRPSPPRAVLVGAVVLLVPAFVGSADAFWLQPSTTWVGIDGCWSTFKYQVGTPAQSVYLTVNTALSEFWVVENTGCSPTALCTTARGGVFDISNSESWISLGEWDLPLPGGNGDYGLETLVMEDTVNHASMGVDKALVAGINTTDYFDGFIGLGVTQTAFDTDTAMGHVITNPYICQLAQTYGYIPSHSYGYTAGASYMGTNGTPTSLTLGGYDTLRFETHNIKFNLDLQTLVPSVRLRGVTAELSSITNPPTLGWNSTSVPLVDFNDSIIATIDTSTPFLWLPTPICERFASALNLVWNESYGVYIYEDTTQYNYLLSEKALSFAFTVSGYDNADNFGVPLNVPGAVNISISSAAFALTLQYPYMDKIAYGAPAVPYFPLKRINGTEQAIIGRAFMQEAYMITNYDEETFSIYQALFPNDAYTNHSTVDIQRPPNSPYPAFVPKKMTTALNTGQTVGVVIGSLCVGVVLTLLTWCCCRRQKRRRAASPVVPQSESEFKDGASADGTEPPRTPVNRIVSLITRRPRRSRRQANLEAASSSPQPVEVGADASHELYELEVPMEPVEMHSPHEPPSGSDFENFGIEGAQPESSYEVQRQQLLKQLQGPVPAYSPRDDKSGQDVSPVAHHRPSDHENPSPVSSPSYGYNSNTIPSPLTPHPDWTVRYDLPSPGAAPSTDLSPQHTMRTYNASTYSPHSPNTFEPSTMSRQTSSSQGSTHSRAGMIPPPVTTYQRTPIDPSRVICLGPLPENVQLPQPPPSIPKLIVPDQQSLPPSSPVSPREPRRSTDTLGSNFTVEEETRIRDEVTRQLSQREEKSPHSPKSLERIDTGLELVHVPQVPDKRYSWEEER